MKSSKTFRTFVFAFASVAITFSLTICARAQTVTTLAAFNGANGSSPFGSVVQATDGNFYGTTTQGGARSTSLGTLFRVTPSGKITDLYNFCSQPNCTDGANSSSAPVLGNDGNLYGVTPEGGSDAGNKSGSGTVYKITLGGKFTTLYTFCRATPCTDGQSPHGLIQASDGNFYGATILGGEFNEGTIFSISSTGKFKSLHSFCSRANCADGSMPISPPIQGSDGNFYGTTSVGGAKGGGVVYKLTPAGAYKVLHSFCDLDCQDGFVPTGLVQDAKGNLFGTTQSGGGSDYFGTVFEITSTNQYKILHTFDYVGAAPTRLTLANEGNLYGTAQGNGTVGVGGIIFEITPEGVFTQLHTFTYCDTSGYYPLSPLFQGTDGTLYGTTLDGGGDGCGGSGTIFSLSNALAPLIETVPVAGKVGKRVLILGNGLTGTTSVTFNGAPAEFTVEKDSFIRATVPAGATTGIVSVETPSGTLTSNPQFVVTK